MVLIEDDTLRLDTVCQPLQYHPGASVTQVVGTTNFPPSFAAAGYASCFKGFGPTPGSAEIGASSLDPAGMAFVQRADVTPEKPEGAAQHVALFKNVLVTADGGKSAKLTVYDVRDWKVKQSIRVGEVSEATTGDSSGSGGPAPASVSALAFDGMTIAVGTHQGFVHTWKLMEHEGKRGYVRLLNPLKVDTLPVTKVHLSPDAQLLTAYSPSKRTLVVWELTTGKVKSAYTVDAVAHGVPMRLTANCETIVACVHAHPTLDDDDNDNNSGGGGGGGGGGKGRQPPPLAALLDVNSGEGGSVRDVAVLEDEGDPLCIAFDGEILALGTSSGAVVAWNVAEGYAAWKGYHGGEVAALASVPGEPARLLSGSADRSVILWDKEGRVQARIELGAGVTALSAATPHTVVAGTSAGMVELLSLCKPESDHDENLTAAARNGRKKGNERIAYDWKHDSKGAPVGHTTFDDFTRRVPVKEGPMPAGAGAGGAGAAKSSSGGINSSKADKAREKSMAKGMMQGLRESVSEEESDEAVAARKKKEEEIEKAKHRAMDDAGVARNPDVRATLDGIRKCSNPTCVEREDTIAGRMLRCSRCKEAVYCSSHCQRTHWRDGHKVKCQPPKKITTAAASAAAAAAATTVSAVAATTKAKEEEKVEQQPPPTPSPAPIPAAAAAAPSSTKPRPPPQRRALVVEDDSEDEDSDEDDEAVVSAPPTPSAKSSAPAPPPQQQQHQHQQQRRALVVEEDSSDEDSSDDEKDEHHKAAAPVMVQEEHAKKRHALVIEEGSEDEDEDDSDEDSDDDTPALPPWMTVNKPPAPADTKKKKTKADDDEEEENAPEKPPSVKPMNAKNDAAVTNPAPAAPGPAAPPPAPKPQVVMDPALQPVSADDLLYDLD